MSNITIENLNNYYESMNHSTETTIHGFNEDLVMTVKKNLSLGEMAVFVNIIVSTVLPADGENAGEYMSLLRDFAIRHATVTLYTDLEMPSDAQQEYDILFGTNIYDAVCALVDADARDEMIKAADNTIANELAKRNSVLQKEVEGAIEEMKKVAELYSDFVETAQKLAGPDMFELAKKLHGSADNFTAAVDAFRQGGGEANE